MKSGSNLKCVATGISVLAFVSSALASTWYVGAVGNAQDAEGYGTSATTPFYSLEYAVGKAAEGDEIVVAPGVYNPRSEITVDKGITITGGANVFLNGASLATTVRFMIIDNVNALVDGLCFSNKNYTVNNTSARRRGVAVEVKQGTLRNSIVAKCSYNGYQNDGVLANEGGVIEDCEVTGCTGAGFYQSYGVGFRQTDGVTTGLKVNNCSPMATFGCGVVLSGGVIDGAVIEENGKDWYQNPGVLGAGVYMDGGELKNAIVRNNINQSGVAGVYVKGSGVVTDCEITGNVVYDIENGGTRAPGLFVDSATASVTGTVITNNALVYQPYPDYFVKAGATFDGNTVLPFTQTAVAAYVSLTGSDTYPYDTPEKAARSVHDALNALCRDADTPVDLYIGEGTFDLDNVLILNRPVRIHGAGRGRSVLAGHGSTGVKCRALFLEDDNALVENLTVYNTYYSYYNVTGGGSGAKMSKGTIRNVSFASCSLNDAYQFAAVYMTGGLLADCEITDSYDKWAYAANGEGLYIGGGLATNCVIHGNTRGDYAANGGHGVYVDGGTVDACVITNNGVSSGCNVNGSGLRLKKGIVRNSLIAGNLSKTGTAGVYIDAGTFENNTVVGNVTATDTTGQSGATVNGSSALIRNNIFYDNGPAGSVVGSVNYMAGTLQTNIVDKTLSGTGNIQASPALDAEFRPELGSPAIEAAAPVAGVDHDLAGTRRPIGDGVNIARPDIGCYEFDWTKVSFTAKISINQNDYPADGETPATASAVVVGASGPVTYAWYLDGGAEPVSTAPQFTSAELSAGRHALRLVVTCGGDVTEDTKGEAFNIRPFVTFAGPDGSDTYPYDTEAKAAHSLNDAVAALWNGAGAQTTVYVGEGIVTMGGAINVQSAVSVIGAGPDKSVLDGCYAGYQGFVLNHDDALLEGLCISNFSYAAQAEKGNGAGVNLTKGTVRNCRITRCRTDGAYQSGSAIYIAGGLASGCEFDHCEHRWAYDSFGNAVYQTGGIVTNCWIHHNPTPCQQGGSGASVYGGLMTHCLITDNGTTATSIAQTGPNDGSGAYVTGNGVLRNCIVRDNINSTKCAGVAVLAGKNTTPNGRVEHCTIYNNNAVSTSSGNSGLVQSCGTVVNSIVYGNGSAYASLGSVTLTGGVFATNLVDKANAAAIGCVVAAPQFVNAEERDLHLTGGSPAVNKGAVLAGEDYDFDGVPRDVHPDLGAYEYVSQGGALKANITVFQTDYPLGAAPTAVAAVDGANTNIIEYGWFVIDDDREEKISAAPSVTWPEAPAGLHNLRLFVRNEIGEVATAVLEGAFNVHPFATFAATNGASIYPYDTVEKAATNVIDAFAAIWSGETEQRRVVSIAAGNYPLTDSLALDHSVSVIGAGRDLVFLDGTGLGKRGAILSSEDALLQGVTISGIRHAAGNGVGVLMSAGTLRDVRVTGCAPTANGINGIGLYMTGGLAEDCDIADNYGENCMYQSAAVGAYVAGGIFRGGAVCGNTYSGGYDCGNCVGLCVAGGLVENVAVVSNGATRASGSSVACAGVRVSGGTLRNAFIWGNATTKASDADGVGLFVDGTAASAENCTVVENQSAGKGVCIISGTLFNTIAWDNPNGDLSAGNMANVMYSCWAECPAPRDGNIGADPCFRNPAAGDRQLSGASPCVNAGVKLDWMADATDFLGLPRLRGGRPDMGCIERQSGGSLIILR